MIRHTKKWSRKSDDTTKPSSNFGKKIQNINITDKFKDSQEFLLINRSFKRNSIGNYSFCIIISHESILL